MKAEEVFLKIGNEFFNEILTVEEFSKEPDFNIIPKAMREYARIQIEKDRKRIKEAYYTKIKKAIPELDDLLSSTPITLD